MIFVWTSSSTTESHVDFEQREGEWLNSLHLSLHLRSEEKQAYMCAFYTTMMADKLLDFVTHYLLFIVKHSQILRTNIQLQINEICQTMSVQ